MCDQLVDILLIGWWWGNWESTSSTSGSNQSGISVLMGSIQFLITSSTWWGFQYLQNSSNDTSQNILYSPWEGTKGLWLCLMAKLLLFCLAWLLSFASAFFLTSLIKFVLWTQGRPRRLKFLNKQEADGGHGEWESVLGRPHRVLLSYNSTSWLNQISKINIEWSWIKITNYSYVVASLAIPSLLVASKRYPPYLPLNSSLFLV